MIIEEPLLTDEQTWLNITKQPTKRSLTTWLNNRDCQKYNCISDINSEGTWIEQSEGANTVD